ILEPVREDGLPVPGGEVAGDTVSSVAAKELAIPEPEAVELGQIGPVQRGEVALEIGRIEEARLEVADGTEQRVREAPEAGRAAEPVHPGPNRGDCAACDQRLLRLRRDRTGLAAAPRDAPKDVVERPARPAEERR